MDLSQLQNYIVDYTTDTERILSLLNANKYKVLFVTKNNKLVGSISDGDIRRYLVKSNDLSSGTDFMNTKPSFIVRDSTEYFKRKAILKEGIHVVPVLNNHGEILEIVDLKLSSHFPVDVVVMAGGRGKRLSPLTDRIPKPLIELNNKPIIDYNYERLLGLGVNSFHISVNYLKGQLKDHFNSKASKKYVNFVEEKTPLGTFGSLSLIDEFENDIILVINSDILTNMDYTLFYERFLESGCDIGLVSVEYNTQLPYAILIEENSRLLNLEEKPVHNYLINTGIYLLRKTVIKDIPHNVFYDATDLLKNYLDDDKKIYIHKTSKYWKDIGKMEDLNQARKDVLSIY